MEEHNLLAVSHDSQDMHLPHLHPLKAHGQSQLCSGRSQLCEHESCTRRTAAADTEALADLHALSYALTQGNHMEMDGKLDLSLGYHAYNYGFLTNASNVEHNVTDLVDDDQSKNGIVATNLACKPSKEKDCPSTHEFTSSVVASQTLPHADGAFSSSFQDEKVFFCKFCDRQFHSSQALGGHQNAHKRERLVARSTPRLGLPPFSCSASRPPFAISPMSNRPHPVLHMLPSCIGGDRSKAFPFPLVAIGDHEEISTHSPMLVSSVLHKERFQAPHHGSAVYKTNFARDYMRDNNAYIIGNRSLGIKAHSLVHKPAGAQALHVRTPQTGHMRGRVGWPRVSIVGRGGMVRGFAPAGRDHSDGSMQTTERFGDTCVTPSLYSATSQFVCHIEAPGRLLQHRQRCAPTPPAHESSCTKSHSCISPSHSSELDSCTRISPGHVDLALRL